MKLNNDGFDLGAQRREIKENDIPEIIRIVKNITLILSRKQRMTKFFNTHS